jgi:phage repressor protein C with HTH and peptisase S24 domain
MWSHVDMARDMPTRTLEKPADERRELLRAFIAANKLKISSWAKQSGVDKNSVYNFLNGHSQSLDLKTYAKLARTASVPVWKLTGDAPDPPSPTAVSVTGAIEAGAFREAVEWDSEDWFTVDVPVPERFQGRAKALQVRGTSMNIDYPDGSIAIWVPMLDFRPPRDGDDVVVYSYRRDGTIEATLKQFRVGDDGEKWLWPRSHDPQHQAPVNTRTPADDIRDIEIVGIVIGSYRPKHY